jgi:hypothetical protein
MIAGMVLSNLLYVVGAIVAATVVSGIVLLRHRRPKSLEAGIEMFSRELKALQPERRVAGSSGSPSSPGSAGSSSAGRVAPDAGAGGGGPSGPPGGAPGRAPGVRNGAGARAPGPVRTFPASDPSGGGAAGGAQQQTGRGEAGAPSSERENEPG